MYTTVPDDKLHIIKELIPRLEEVSNTTIELDEKTKSIKVTPKQGNAYDAMKVKSVINAIGLGFSVDDAMKLMSDDYVLEVIELKDFSNSVDSLRRIKGRIIGEKGKAKKIIQEYTGVQILVGDHIVALLGNVEQMSIAKRAIELLLKGKEHNTVYKYLDEAERAMSFAGSKGLKEGLNKL
ncbi:RNA-processing protein [Stygiolobus sp. KN-1]|uniref:RNA-processing protein n=1 Tax=Stygiolobus caldivivus TaxID=2824673 RepID=A0A8D5U401_9CREN|nr:RNA-processing protein [Stygiolobus caldivivus]